MSKERLQRKILSEIRNRYIFAVCLIGSFAILTFMVNRTLNQRMNEDFKTINLSGRQRMLSQRIALLRLRGDTVNERDAVNQFRDGLNFLLTTRFVKPAYRDVYELYKKKHGLEEQSREFLSAAESPVTPESQARIFSLSQELLKKYETVTYLKQHISESEFRNHLFLEIMILLLNLMILVFEVAFIFRPMAGRVKHSFAEMNRIEEQSFAASRLALIGEIASGIGHEIKNPLFALRHYAGKISDAHVRELIEKNADRISRIIRALSTQARESSGDQMEETSVSTIIDDALEMFRPRIRYGNIDLQKSINFDGPLLCKHAAISQVIANLISNAIDAISESDLDQKSIRIESGEDIDGVYVRVLDSGPGVPQELSEKIFESFVTTKKDGKGTGLGLPISRRIMEEHHGSLRLNPQVSRSCFELRFPA